MKHGGRRTESSKKKVLIYLFVHLFVAINLGFDDQSY